MIENIHPNGYRRVDVPVGTDYGVEIDRVREVLQEAISSIPKVLEEPKPEIFLKELGVME